ncbi:MAG: LptF/LptG family permease [Phycisphaeraceae bacterium]
MKTLDRYILREFLINFVLLGAVLMLLFVVVDLIVDLDRFLRAGQARADEYGSTFLATVVVIGDYYGPVLIMLYVFFAGLLVVGAVGFTFAAFQRTGELTAMVASGLSLYRVALPMVVAGIALNLAILPIQELVIPALAPKLARSSSEAEHRTVEAFPVRLAYDEQGNLLTARAFDAAAGTLDDLTVIQRRPDGLTERRITAAHAVWEADHGRWRLEPPGLADRPATPASPATSGTRTPRAEGPDIAFSYDDDGPEHVEHLPTELSPTVLMARNAGLYPQFLSMAELQAMQANPAVEPAQRQQIAGIIWSRFSMIVTNVLILLMALGLVLRIQQPNALVQGIKTAGLALGAWGGGLVMLQASAAFLNPVAAAWLPVALYLPVAAIMLQRART